MIASMISSQNKYVSYPAWNAIFRAPRFAKSSNRRMPYTPSTTTSTLPSSCRTGNSRCRPKCRELSDDSKIVIANPTAIADRKKKTGSSGLYQNGCSFSGRIRYRVPSEDWCSVDKMTPQITSGIRIARTTFKGFCRLNRSSTIGENSSARTVVYNITQYATSNITECGLRMISGCQMLYGLPRSYISAAQTRM